MSKKKAVVCTILFSIIMFSIFIALILIKNEYGNDGYWYILYDFFSSFIVGMWIGGKINAFYNWLRH